MRLPGSHCSVAKRIWTQRLVMHTMAHRSSTVQQSEYAQRQIADDVVDFAAGQPSPRLLPLHEIAKAAADRLSGPAADPLLLQYGPEQGYGSFRCTLSSFLTQHYQAAVPPDHLLITAGVSHGLDLVCRHLASPGDVLLLEQPTYFLAQTIFNQNRLQAVPIPSDDQGINTQELERLLAGPNAPRPRLLYIIPVHSNPRGVTLPLERRQHLIRLAHQYNFLIVADEVYQLLSFPSAPQPPQPMRVVEQQLFAVREQPAEGTTLDAAAAAISATNGRVEPSAVSTSLRAAAGSEPAAGAVADAAMAVAGADTPADVLASAAAGASGGHGAGGADGSSSSTGKPSSLVVSLGSFSKIMAPGLRLGWVEAGQHHLQALCKDGVLASGGSIAPLASGVAHSALEMGLVQQHLHHTIRPALERQCQALCAALQQHLPGYSFHHPQGGYFVWLQLPEQVDSRAFLQFASTNHRVKFAPGAVCQGPPNCIRMSFSFYEPVDIEVGVQRLAAALQAYLAQ